MMAISALLLVVLGVLSGSARSQESENRDVVEGQSIRLSCRFNPYISGKRTVYWMCQTQKEQDIIAMNSDSHKGMLYKVDFKPEEGRSDLTIIRAEYEKDNSKFECRFKDMSSGTYTVISAFTVTVLIPPGPPQISPPKPVAREGETFALSCMSQGGSPDPIVQWYREDIPLQGQLQKGGSRDRPTTSVLSINPRMEDDNATYKCAVWNRAIPEELKMETNVQLRVQYAPRIRVGPFNPLRIMVNGDAMLTCNVNANPPIRSVRWMKSGQLLSHTMNHTIPSVKPEDSGTYTCIAENGIGEATQINLELAVLYGPTVNLLPEKEVSLGESLAVKCNIASYPPPHTVEWIKENNAFFRQNGDTLRLESVSSEDSGKYFCKATTTARPSGSSMQREFSSNSSIIIHIKHKPGETIISPSTLEAVSGKPFTLMCSAKPPGYPLPEYRWWKEGQEKMELSRKANYTLLSAHVSHEGQYYCQTQNSLGYGSIASAYLTVYEPVSLTIPLRPQIIRKETDTGFSITCRARGKPMPQVQWSHDGQTIPADSGFFKIETVNSVEDNNVNSLLSTLKFEGRDRKNGRLTSEDRGKFACVYDNGFGEVSSVLSLKVEHSPIVKHTYNRVAFDTRETAVLKCIMQAYPEPVFEWFHYGRALDNYGNYGTNVTNVGGDTYVGILSIKDLTENDYGEYTCRAWNQVGDKKTIIKLVKKSVPERPSNIELVDSSSDKITLRWSEGFNGGFASTEYLITYWPAAENVKGRNETCRSQTVCEVIGLQSETEYKFKVLAVNPRGYSQYSDEVIIKTKPNLRDLPRAIDAHFDKDTSQLTFSVDAPPMPLLAKVQARYADTDDWIMQKYIEIHSPEQTVYLTPGSQSFSDVRVTLCLQSNESWCGDAKIASPFDDSSPRTVETAGVVRVENMYIIITVAGALGLLIIVGFVCFYGCRRSNKDNKKKQEIKTLNAGPPPVTLPYYSEENLTKHGDVLDSNPKSNIYMSGMQDVNNDHMCNGGNDHGLLYPGDRDMGCMVPNSHLNMLLKNGEMPDGSYYPFEGEMVNDYYSGNDYKQVNGDMMNMKNREHLHSPYYDVSGLPDPYSMRDDEKMHPNSMCFDETLESGYSTPNSRNRRIIREIIV